MVTLVPDPAAPGAPPLTAVNAGVAASTVTLLFRQAGLFMAGGTLMLGFAHHHDLGGFIAWAQTDTGAQALAGIATLVIAAWGQRHNLAQKLALLTAARDPRNHGIFVTGEPDTLPPPIPPTPAR